MRTVGMAFSPDGSKWVPGVPQPYHVYDITPDDWASLDKWTCFDWGLKAAVDVAYDGASVVSGELTISASGMPAGGISLDNYMIPYAAKHPARSRGAIRWRRRGAAAAPPSYVTIGMFGDGTVYLPGSAADYPVGEWQVTFWPRSIALQDGYYMSASVNLGGEGWTPNSAAQIDVDWIAFYNDADF